MNTLNTVKNSRAEYQSKWVADNRDKWNAYMRERGKSETILKGGKLKSKLSYPVVFSQQDEIVQYLIKDRLVSISIEDKEVFERYKWRLIRAVQKEEKYYVITSCNQKTIYLHRLIMQLEDKNMVVDHRNGNTLDCTRTNLRVVTQSENSKNRK